MSLQHGQHIINYTEEELASFYPDGLQLRLVQVLFRHGERTPVRQRLDAAGFPTYYQSCYNAEHFRAAVRASSGWGHLPYARRVEAPADKINGTGFHKEPTGPGTCLLGELTDRGRESTLNLGSRLRELYVERLHFADIKTEQELYLRASPIVRTQESLHHVLAGMYPRDCLPEGFRPIIHQRDWTQENLYPNEMTCQRLKQLSKAYAVKAAEKWNPILAGRATTMLSKKYLGGDPVRVDGNPSVSGIADTVYAALGNRLPVPAEFTDPEVAKQLEDAVVEEWFGGYLVNEAYRRLGAGPLLADLRDRIISSARQESPLKVALYGAHDTTIGSTLAALGVFDKRWPPFASHIALELFEDQRDTAASSTPTEHASHLVRLRYNDKILSIPGCRQTEVSGLSGFCTLQEFKKIVDDMVPLDRTQECRAQ